MEECEALCTRLAIMVNGNFKCLGSVQHLKNKFAAGYTLTIKLKGGPEKAPSQTEFERVEKFVSTNFSSAKLQEKHHELLIYYISDQSVKWSKMFGILERGKHRLNIEGYSLGQASLEQVCFVHAWPSIRYICFADIFDFDQVSTLIRFLPWNELLLPPNTVIYTDHSLGYSLN
jgi:hypothetical protein